MIDFVATFILFFAVIDPIGTVPVFIAVTSGSSSAKKRKLAVTAVLAAAGILLFFVIAGELIFNAMSIPLTAFQIAGGIVLFLFAMSMIFGESKPEEEVKLLDAQNQDDSHDTAIFPLAVPSIAGPGAMLAAVLMTENSKHSILEQIQISVTMLVVLALTLVLMLLASSIHRLIGNGGASLVSRVMGMILASVAVANVLEGLRDFFNL